MTRLSLSRILLYHYSLANGYGRMRGGGCAKRLSVRIGAARGTCLRESRVGQVRVTRRLQPAVNAQVRHLLFAHRGRRVRFGAGQAPSWLGVHTAGLSTGQHVVRALDLWNARRRPSFADIHAALRRAHSCQKEIRDGSSSRMAHHQRPVGRLCTLQTSQTL